MNHINFFAVIINMYLPLQATTTVQKHSAWERPRWVGLLDRRRSWKPPWRLANLCEKCLLQRCSGWKWTAEKRWSNSFCEWTEPGRPQSWRGCEHSQKCKRISDYVCIILMRVDMLSGETTLVSCFYFPSEKGSTIKGKNLLPMGANSFLLE